MRLHTRIFALVIFLLVGLGGTNLLFFYSSARDKVEADTRDRLLVADRSFVDLFEARQTQLTSSVHAIVNDWALRQAVGQQDRPTAIDVLVNHSTRVEADIAFFMTKDGELFASTLPLESLPSSVKAQLDDSPKSSHLIARLNDRHYQLVLEEVRAPVPVGWLAMGFLIDNPLARRLSLLSDVEVSFLHQWDGDLDVFATSIEQRDRATAGAIDYPGDAMQINTVQGQGFEDLVLHRSLDPQRPGMRVALQRSLLEPINAFRSWWWSLATIFMLITALALGLAWTFSRGITRPLSELLAAIRGIEAGDYSANLAIQRKDEIGLLSKSFTRMQRAVAEREEEILYRADHDLTTGTLNRNGFLDSLERQIEPASLSQTAIAVVCLRIRHFQQIVDALGHDWGDKLLKLVAGRLKDTFPGSSLAHLNSDEFFMTFPAQDISRLFSIGEQLHDALSPDFSIRAISLTLNANLGISVYPDHATDSQSLLRKANVALNEATERHQRTIVYDPELDQNSVKRLTLMSELPKAIKAGQLELHYQPKITCASPTTVAAAECLVRWQHPELGMVPPDDFIGLAEKTGYIVELSQFVLSEAIRQCAQWRKTGVGLTVSVNISALDLTQDSLVKRVKLLLEQHRLPADALCLEITESAAMEDPETALLRLSALKALGIRLSIDDYGTGYSSLAQLKKLPVQELKIDKSFVMELDRNEDDRTIVRSTIDLAHSIGLEVVAEGVESKRILWQLQQWGADLAQGYHISRPLPGEAFMQWLQTSDYEVRPVLATVKAGRDILPSSAI
jgi:diguanylate cyclase (GGDEF)-like protein